MNCQYEQELRDKNKDNKDITVGTWPRKQDIVGEAVEEVCKRHESGFSFPSCNCLTKFWDIFLNPVVRELGELQQRLRENISSHARSFSITA
jgi:hypothetical protein